MITCALFCAFCVLESEPERGADHVQIPRDANAVVLSQVKEILREVLVENFGYSDCETIAHPAINTPVVKHLITDKERQL